MADDQTTTPTELENPAAAAPQPEGQQELTAQQPEVLADHSTGEAAPEAAAPEAKPTATDWRDREIARLRARLQEERSRTSSPQVQPQATPTQGAAPVPDLDSMVSARVAQLEFDRRCAAAAEEGKKAFGEDAFQRSVQGLMNLVDRNDNQQVDRYNTFLLAALETGEAPKLVHSLGSDPDEAARIMALPATRMAVELTRLAAKEPQKISRAPRPINPVASTSRMNTSPILPDDPDRGDQLSTREWMRRREEQIATARAAGRQMR